MPYRSEIETFANPEQRSLLLLDQQPIRENKAQATTKACTKLVTEQSLCTPCLILKGALISAAALIQNFSDTTRVHTSADDSSALFYYSRDVVGSGCNATREFNAAGDYPASGHL